MVDEKLRRYRLYIAAFELAERLDKNHKPAHIVARAYRRADRRYDAYKDAAEAARGHESHTREV